MPPIKYWRPLPKNRRLWIPLGPKRSTSPTAHSRTYNVASNLILFSNKNIVTTEL